MDREDIEKILPHRDPYLMIDEIRIDVPGRKGTGIRRLTGGEYFFEGHFPEHPIMPGVLIIEALAQTCGVLVLRMEEYKGKLAYFASINNAKFRKPVFPGDTLILDITVTKHRPKIVQVRGVAKIGEEVVAEADLLFTVVEAPK